MFFNNDNNSCLIHIQNINKFQNVLIKILVKFLKIKIVIILSYPQLQVLSNICAINYSLITH